jgi:hypothetical protein
MTNSSPLSASSVESRAPQVQGDDGKVLGPIDVVPPAGMLTITAGPSAAPWPRKSLTEIGYADIVAPDNGAVARATALAP